MLQTQITAQILAYVTGAADHGTPKANLDLRAHHVLPNGTGAGQGDRVFSDRRQLAASANETLDLSGALTDALGQPAVFAKVKAILIRADAGNVNNVVIGGAAAPFLGPLGGTAPTITLPPGASVLLAAPTNGWAVADGVSDGLRVANSGAGSAVNYDVMLIGTSG